MINLNATPEAALHLNEGEHATIDGTEVIMCKSDADGRFYLTTADSRVQEYHAAAAITSKDDEDGDWIDGPTYSDYIKHVRHHTGRALMTRRELAYIITTGSYRIA